MATAIYDYFQKQHSKSHGLIIYKPGNKSDFSVESSELNRMEFSEAIPIIRKTWAMLMKQKETVGGKIYEYIMHKEISMAKLFMETNLKAQSAIFMDMMNKVVHFLDDEPSMDAKLQQLGKDHVIKYKVKTRHFKHFRSAFLKAIKKYLPWTDRREEAWQLFWSRIIAQMSMSTQANHYPQIRQFEGRQLSTEEMIEFAHNIHVTFDVALTSDPKGFAEKFYGGLLKEQPDIGQLFLDKNTTFDTQSARFMAMLMHAIKMLDDTDHFTQSLDSLSEAHVGYGVEIPMLSAFGKSLISQVKRFNIDYYEQQTKGQGDDQKEETLDILKVGRWTQKQDDSWKWFWSVVVGVMSAGMTKVKAAQKKGSNNAKREIPSKEEMMNMDFSAL